MPDLRSPEVKFWSKVNKSEGCWQWIGAFNSAGYGHLQVMKKAWLAHRYSYTMLVGEIQPGLVLDHLCRNRACVNPSHLEPKTHKENLQADGSLSPAKLNAELTHCSRGHELREPNLDPWSMRVSGWRKCLACTRGRQWHRNHPNVELQAATDAYYREIMGEAAA